MTVGTKWYSSFNLQVRLIDAAAEKISADREKQRFPDRHYLVNEMSFSLVS